MQACDESSSALAPPTSGAVTGDKPCCFCRKACLKQEIWADHMQMS